MSAFLNHSLGGHNLQYIGIDHSREKKKKTRVFSNPQMCTKSEMDELFLQRQRTGSECSSVRQYCRMYIHIVLYLFAPDIPGGYLVLNRKEATDQKYNLMFHSAGRTKNPLPRNWVYFSAQKVSKSHCSFM